MSQSPCIKGQPEALAEKGYQALKKDIFEFRLMFRDRFSKTKLPSR